MVIPIYQPAQARQTILKRRPADETPVPQAVLDGIAELMGEPLSPQEAVGRILNDIRRRGNEALADWSEKLDGYRPAVFRIPENEIQSALEGLPTGLRAALENAAHRIEHFHRRQPLHSWITQEMGGTLGQLIRPIRRVGIYAPGGTAPLPSTILMSAIPARVAGVEEIVIASPPQRGSASISPVMLAAAALVGVKEVYTMGGAQAIAALAFGTASIPAVDKIVGPGNLFVTLAKQQVYGTVGIDGLAGPTETVIIADESARPDWVAADLLAQAEHDVLAAAILLTPSRSLVEQVQVAIEKRLAKLADLPKGRAAILHASLSNRSGIVITRDLDEAVGLSNEYGPEHLNLVVEQPWTWVERINSAGGIFVGEQSYEVLGDYVAGPSHVMPTGGTARFSSPLNALDFVRIISLIALDAKTARQIGRDAAKIAHAEGLISHAHSAEARQEE